MSPCAKSCTRKCTEETQGSRNIPAFPAQWLDGLCRDLPGAEFGLVSVTSRIDDAAHPVGRACASAKLDCSNGSQDHTVLPYADSASPA